MYKDYFSLTNKVFGRYPEGTESFMGSQQARIKTRLADALSSADTIVAVTGPVGSGKTTVVEAALKAISGEQLVARIARIKLRHDEVLELLLNELGVDHVPPGTIQQFTGFKRRLKEWQEQGTHVFIVVEDAQRIGSDAIAELETLTSAEAGGASGASIVLMGLPELHEQLNADALTRTKQRTSLQLSLQPFSAAEVRDYLAHRFAVAGGDAGAILEDGATDMIYRFTDGRPRVINKLCEAVLHAAAEKDLKTVSSELVERIARDEFAMEPVAQGTVPDASTAAAVPPADVPDEGDAVPELIQDTLPAVEALAEATPSKVSQRIVEPRIPEALTMTDADPAAVKELDDALRPDTGLLEVLNEQPVEVEDDAPVPLGLQEQMSEQPAAPSENGPLEAPTNSGADVTATNTNIPTLSDSMRIDSDLLAVANAEVNDTRTPRKPNLQALETAIAAARKGPVELDADIAVDAFEEIPTAQLVEDENEIDTADGDETDLPQITLDDCLQERPNVVAAPAEETNPSEALEEEEKGSGQENAKRAKLNKLAADLGSAKSLEEIDDVAAETLFGEEFSHMAAAVAAMAAEVPANDPDAELTLAVIDDDADEVADDSVRVEVEQAPLEPAEVPAMSFASITPDETPATLDINASASRRFDMLRAMNESSANTASAVAKKPAASKADETAAPAGELAEEKGPQLTPIENQFGSSMTETLKALKFDRPPEEDDGEEHEEKSGGFLSRFKRS